MIITTRMQVAKSIKNLKKKTINQLEILQSIVGDNSVKIDNGFDSINNTVNGADRNFPSAIQFIKSIEYNYGLDALDYQLADNIIKNLKVLQLVRF